MIKYLENHSRETIFLFLFVIFNCDNLSLMTNEKLNYNLHTFYYAWYGNNKIDGKQRHWNHEVLPHWSNKEWDNYPDFQGGKDIGANFYPELGNYSSNDTNIVQKHMEMIAQAGIGVVTLSWWGENSFEDKNVKMIMDIADSKKIKINFHLEPTSDRTSEKVVEMIQYIIDNYEQHNAFYKFKDKPLFYIYDSYHIKKSDWTSILAPEGNSTIRGTDLDSYIIGLWVHEDEGGFFIDGGFDGIYTYFASNGFTFGSDTKNWKYLSRWASKNKKIFIPCVGPGYSDSRIRPWNIENYKNRDGGKYYDKMFEAAITSSTDIIGITSFNEWHEGTQIEPAIPKNIETFEYEDYQPQDKYHYIKKTKIWSKRFVK